MTMMCMTKYVDDREILEYRIDEQKISISFPKGADVRIGYVGDVRKHGEKPVTGENMFDDYFEELPIAPWLYEPKQVVENG